MRESCIRPRLHVTKGRFHLSVHFWSPTCMNSNTCVRVVSWWWGQLRSPNEVHVCKTLDKILRSNPHHTHKETNNGFHKPQDMLKTWHWMGIFLLWLLSATNLDLSGLDCIKCTGRLGILLVKSVLRLIKNQNFLCPLWIIWARKQRKFWILNFIVKKKNRTKTVMKVTLAQVFCSS